MEGLLGIYAAAEPVHSVKDGNERENDEREAESRGEGFRNLYVSDAEARSEERRVGKECRL